jgi:APA family basic amino acid/polyamine antiporter
MVAAKIKDPSRNITRSLFIGVLVCIVVYVLITVAYLYVLPVDELAGSPTVASDAVARALGSNAGVTIAALIVLSTFGAVSANLLANSRVIFSMAQGGNFFAWAAKIHPRNQTPGNSVVLLGVWSSILIITGSFDILTDMFIFMSWFFYLLVVLAVMVMRKKMPDAISAATG